MFLSASAYQLIIRAIRASDGATYGAASAARDRMPAGMGAANAAPALLCSPNRVTFHSHVGCFSAAASTGILRRRFPVAAKIAFAMAGTIPEVPVSPMPPGGSMLLTT